MKTIDSRIISTKFTCDLEACKGACCTFPGGLGAPVLVEEAEILQKAFGTLKHRLPTEHVDVAERYGLLEHHEDSIHLRCYDQRACVFVSYDGPIAKCTIQQAFFEGAFEWEKPVSCHLFPIRVHGKNRDRLRFEEFSECQPALDEGERRGTHLVDFLESAITRAFGADFHASLREALRDTPHDHIA
jgi:hypothetical protein